MPDLENRACARRRFLRTARMRKGVILPGLAVLLAAACAMAPTAEAPRAARDTAADAALDAGRAAASSVARKTVPDASDVIANAAPGAVVPNVVPAAALDVRVERLAAELRCLVCDNQTIADSNAQLARDLKARVREQLAAGRSEAQVIAFLTERYGDFVLYRPPVKASTWVLWFGPFVLPGFGLWWLWKTLARQQRAPRHVREGDR